MGWFSDKIFILILFTLMIVHCISENSTDDSLIYSGIYQNSLSPTLHEFQSFHSCIVSAHTNKGRISVCFQMDSGSCSAKFFNNISTAVILQKRKDDLNFININYTNCSTSSISLFARFNLMTPPSSTFLQDYFGINKPDTANLVSFASKDSCEALGLLTEKFVPNNFSRLLTEQELIDINSVEVELALVDSTNEACIGDLSFQPDFLPIVSSLRSKEYLRGISCSHTLIDGYELCPWIE